MDGGLERFAGNSSNKDHLLISSIREENECIFPKRIMTKAVGCWVPWMPYLFGGIKWKA